MFFFLIIFLFPFFFKKVKQEENFDKEESSIIIDYDDDGIEYKIIYKEIHYYCYKESDFSYDSISNTKYIITDSGNYYICSYGPKAKKGGRGGIACGENYFQQNSELKFTLGARQVGGKGGKNCGFWENGDGFNGAGFSMVEHKNGLFMVVAGGGGGDSESGNKGGDAEKDGEGQYNGKGATSLEGGKGGEPKNTIENGASYSGGSGFSSSKTGKYCGGGGGSGYFGGGAGDYGNKGADGGGGGGSNFCQASNCSYRINNETDYSCIKIYNIKKERIN